MTTAILPVDSSHSSRQLFFGRLTNADNGAVYLVFALLVAYSALPLGLALVLEAGDYFLELAAVSAVAAVFVWLGSRLPILDPLRVRVPRFVLSREVFTAIVWSTFVVFAFTAWLTAARIPLLAALAGSEPDQIAELREQFLKAREGWQASFVYINAILSGALIPYSIAMMFVLRMPGRWLAFGFFLFFCISFVEKAFFLKAALPLFYLMAQRRVRLPLRPTTLLWSMFGLLVLVTILSGAGSVESTADEVFFSAKYAPEGPLAHLVWRAIAIPLVTAADALRVLYEEFGGRVLWGATSSLIAGLTGMEHVAFERLVFAAQWGQNETETGSSNSVFITEAYVNFGWAGVVIFSVLVGVLMRLFAKSRDEAFRSLWMLFTLGIYTSGLIGLLFSNGFILLFALNLLVKFKGHRVAHEVTSLHDGLDTKMVSGR